MAIIRPDGTAVGSMSWGRKAAARTVRPLDLLSAVTWSAIMLYLLACVGATVWIVGTALNLW